VGVARTILITASNDTYAPLVLDWLRALQRLKFAVTFDIGMLDLGLSPDIKDALASFGVIFKIPKADIDYPGRETWEQQAPYYRAMTSRPYLRDYFTGYDAYMWMDADAWAQTPEAIDTMLTAATTDDALYIAAEFDRDYAPYFNSSQPSEFHLKWYKANFPEALVNAIFPRPMLNTGVMAMSALAPIWDKWAETFSLCLKNLPQLTRENFMSEQLSLNIAQYANGLPLRVMPAEFNWLTLYSLPMIDKTTGYYVRPTMPRTVLSVIHITHQKKLSACDLAVSDGTTQSRQLSFSAYEKVWAV
jgi:hypothetical protein